MVSENRVNLRMPMKLIRAADIEAEKKGYPNRSELIRQAVRETVSDRSLAQAEKELKRENQRDQ